MQNEKRNGVEFRVAGRTLSGTVLRYGDISSEYRERFLSGAFHPVPPVELNIQHDPAMVVLKPGKFALNDFEHALEIRADLPAGSAALELVKRGALRGFSLEFKSRKETRSMGVRVIERALLVGIGLVDQPSYPDSVAEVRALGDRGGRLGSYRGYIPSSKVMQCKCVGPNCNKALFEQGSFDDLLDDDLKREILAVAGDYNAAIGTKGSKAIRFWEGKDNAIHFAIDIPNSARGRALLETNKSVPVFGRPYIDQSASNVVKNSQTGVATYKKAHTRAIIVNPTDASDGWPELEFRPDVDMEFPLEDVPPIPGVPNPPRKKLLAGKLYLLHKLFATLDPPKEENKEKPKRRSLAWL